MSGNFIGRTRELALLRKRLDHVGATGSGIAAALSGRRQVGKSRLVQEFCDASGVPYFFFTATKGASPRDSVAAFCSTLRESALPRHQDLVPILHNGEWSQAFQLLAATLPDNPVIVVLDEVPWLSEQDETFDGTLQIAWDRLLSQNPVLLLLLGSDVTMMERLTAYNQPFFGRADNMILDPLNPAEVGRALGLENGDAVDAHLLSGGLPGIIRRWPRGIPALEFVREECADPASVLFSVPESALLNEFPSPDISRRVLEAVGGGDRTQANIAATAGQHESLHSGTLSPLLRLLHEDKRILAVDKPLSTRPGKPALYHIADTNMRAYVAMLREAQELARRGRSKAAYQLVEQRWASWRGRAVEPLVRNSLEQVLPHEGAPWGKARVVGGWWNRQFNPEVDLVGADREPVAKNIYFVGSIKWLNTPFDTHDFSQFAASATHVPGFTVGSTCLVVVSLSGVASNFPTEKVDLKWTASDVVEAWDG